MLDSLLKFQYPNPYEKGFKTWNTKPFINTLRLIKQVNKLCSEKGLHEKGISKIEFGIFVLSLTSYSLVDEVAKRILEFRKNYESLISEEAKDNFTKNYISNYLKDFKNPISNVKEYTDNMIRYLRLTKYIYIRGKYTNTYIDLEPRRKTEIDSILNTDNGCAQIYTHSEWRNYMGVYGTYKLPFETYEKLTQIATEIQTDINHIETKLGLPLSSPKIPNSIESLKQFINNRRADRTRLQNLKIKQDYHANTSKIEETIASLEDIRKRNKSKLVNKFSIELEKWTNVALNILNDSKLIKPNAPVGDDNEPIYTAPNGVPDIECYYDSFGAICEVIFCFF